MTFEIRNRGSETYRLMSWDLPIEGEALKFLRVTRGEVELEYDGKLVRHGEPSASAYVTLHPGESTSVETDISRLYPVQLPGEYTVTLDARLNDVYAGTALRSRSVESLEPLRLLETSVTFMVEAGDPPRMTIGQAVRLQVPEPPEEAQARYAPAFLVGGTQTERDHTLSAHLFAEWLSGKARDKLLYADTAYLYKRWFGANLKPFLFLPSYKDTVTTNYGRISDRLNSWVPVTYDLTRTGCAGGHAWTVANSATIYLCQPFFDNNVYPGFWSKTITLIHEWVHAAVGYSGDPASGKDQCLNLAATNPGVAIGCAENYAAFADEI
ncbi:M35 family metallo-endopeptidase [Streptomyces gardneri]|uniref:M35 family metallo-endopeptidase n=1 Tax=Streptomyces gardneri TaxID=66892 RepID=UPI0035D63129